MADEAIKLKWVMRVQRPPNVVAKQLRHIVTTALMKLGQYWWKEVLPVHFTEEGAKRYGYAPRTVRYIIRKRTAYARGKTKVKPMPLVYTGNMRTEMTSYTRIASSSKAARIHMRAPAYMRQRGKQGTGPDKRKELHTMTKVEIEGQQGRLAWWIAGTIKGIQHRETKELV